MRYPSPVAQVAVKIRDCHNVSALPFCSFHDMSFSSLSRRLAVLFMSFFRSGVVSLIVASTLCGQAMAKTACDTASDGQIEISMKEVGAAIGYMWGHGTLTYGGQRYPISVKGGGALALGSATVTGSGCVRNLSRLVDFEGTYWTVGGDVAIGSGPAGIVMENAKGVDMSFSGNTHGAHLSGQISRLYFKIDSF